MRRLIFTLATVVSIVSLAFAASRPSLDGRAVVAEEGVMPAGLFAKTVGYLPGDSVSVTNPATGITINVLVLGSIDPSAGVAILLSPEAADKLFITPETHTQVKITKRVGMLDESVSGSGTLVGDTAAGGLLPGAVKDSLDSRLEAVDETLGPTPMTAEGPVAGEASPKPETEPTEDKASDLVLVVPEEPSGEEESPSESAAGSTEEDSLSEYMVTSTEEVPLNHVLAEHNPVYIVESVDETVEPIPLPSPAEDTEETTIAEIVEPAPDSAAAGNPESATPPQVAASEEAETESTEEAIVLVPVETSVPELVSSTVEETLVEEPLPESEEDSALASASQLADPFSPIILVPADENPPAEAQSTFTPTPLSPAATAGDVAKNIPPAADSLGTANRGLVKSLSELERGKYYVQIATLAEQNNIDKLLGEYGSKYPLVMVPMKSGKAMQMMVGPLNVDEYGAILAKFKNLGFKDSFLRKIR